MLQTQPVFICGALRSGSTLLHLMLDHHPHIKNPGEFDFMFDYINDSVQLPEITQIYEDLKADRIFRSHDLKIDTALDYISLQESFINQMLDPETKVLAFNIHRNFESIPRIFGDNAKYVHLLRDPRDVANSSIQMGWVGNVYNGVNHWIDTELSWEALEKRIKPEQFITIRYEQLIAEPEKELTRMTEFMGVAYDQRMLDYPKSSTYSKPDAKLAQQWKKKLNNSEVQLVESKTGSLMVARGYELSGYPIKAPFLIERIGLELQNKIYRHNFNIKRYGISLYFFEKLTAKMGLEKLNKKLLIEAQEIDTRYLK